MESGDICKLKRPSPKYMPPRTHFADSLEKQKCASGLPRELSMQGKGSSVDITQRYVEVARYIDESHFKS
jgi:hypothetical protein